MIDSMAICNVKYEAILSLVQCIQCINETGHLHMYTVWFSFISAVPNDGIDESIQCTDFRDTWEMHRLSINFVATFSAPNASSGILNQQNSIKIYHPTIHRWILYRIQDCFSQIKLGTSTGIWWSSVEESFKSSPNEPPVHTQIHAAS